MQGILVLEEGFILGTGYEYDGNVFVAWVLQVRRRKLRLNDQPVSGHGHLTSFSMHQILFE
jgi:hypothetical protein